MTCTHDRTTTWRWRRKVFGVLGRVKHVRGICGSCGEEVYAETEFGVWVERNKVATKLGGRCWIQDTRFADACSCADCHKHDRGAFKVHSTDTYYS